ncbi:5'/3'-nucleotidase SurE [Hoeflea ulvae]|uniref:5'-nucleotidase SurE n=1 Tax=Hoeflea ulvae TaxID=2983764 RepID=A0ABT3YEE6_9HYPH|nr:5'/3'-nucleotidase SurE [Hoeflea ulvae]MCY0094265.1 5'/3'-nucleotidase SurE [Hoeflea ulvae]
MRILVCNDDGIEAPGLAMLERVARRLSDDVWVVAPDGKRTAASGSITIARPLQMTRLGDQRYACSGTPADCVVTAMTWLFAGIGKPDLVLSGVNDGRNVGEDLAYSGTLGIAREATFWNIPAIGFSRVKNPEMSENDEVWLSELIGTIWAAREQWFDEGHWLAMNLPTVLPAPVRQPRIGRDKIGRTADIVGTDGDVTTLIVPRGRSHAASEGDDNHLLDSGHVCINRLNWFGQKPLEDSLLAQLPG